MRAQSGYLHCFRNIVPRGLDKQKKQDLVFSVKLRFLRLEKLPKNGCPKNVQILWGPKQAIMVQKWPFLKPKSKLKSNIHQKLWNKKIFIFMNCTKNLKKTRNFDYFILLFWKNKLKFDAKDSIYSFFVLKR